MKDGVHNTVHPEELCSPCKDTVDISPAPYSSSANIRRLISKYTNY